jgi:hypothetical protein
MDRYLALSYRENANKNLSKEKLEAPHKVRCRVPRESAVPLRMRPRTEQGPQQSFTPTSIAHGSQQQKGRNGSRVHGQMSGHLEQSGTLRT